MLYAASAIGQLIAVDTGSHTYLYFTESSGSLIYLRRLEVDTKDAETISSGQDAILYAIHDNTIYYTNAKKQLWTLSMEGGEEICLVDDLTVNAFCFSDKYLYLQTDDAVIEATPKGKQIRTLENVKPGFSLTSPTGGSYICPILARDGKLIFADSETMYLKSCDLENGSIADLIDAVCYNYEIYLDGFLYTTMYTDTPTLNYMNNGQDASDTDNNAFPIWAYSQTETLVRTQPDNAVNGSFGRMTSEYAYFISKGALYGIDLSTNSTKRITNQSGTCSDLNVLPDGTLYAVSQVNGACKIDSTKAGNIYTGTDLRDLQYYRKDGYEKLIFTDLDKNGDRYAYSVGMDGKLLTRLSHVPCAQGSLAVQGSLMIYTDTERKHLYSASIAGQGAFEVYAAVDDGSVICQAIPGDENGFYLSVRGSKGEMHFLTVDYTGSVVRDKQVNIKQFGFAGGTLYAIDPTDGALYRYTDPLGDLTQRTQVYKKNVEAINIAEVSGEYAIFFRTKDGNVYCTSADTETPIDLTARTKSVS